MKTWGKVGCLSFTVLFLTVSFWGFSLQQPPLLTEVLLYT